MKNKLEDKEVLDMLNIYFDNRGHLKKREGYKSFVGLIKMLYRINKNNEQYGVKGKYEIILPVKWI